MKQLLLSIVAAFVGATAMYAQSNLVATLSHEGTTTAFYGADALVQAHEAAADGDVITLSSGAFTATAITKCISLRGAGMKIDTNNQKEPTVINGHWQIGFTGKTITGLSIEGIHTDNAVTCYGTLTNAVFSKNRFEGFGYDRNCLSLNCSFFHCIFANYPKFRSTLV